MRWRLTEESEHTWCLSCMVNQREGERAFMLEAMCAHFSLCQPLLTSFSVCVCACLCNF